MEQNHPVNGFPRCFRGCFPSNYENIPIIHDPIHLYGMGILPKKNPFLYDNPIPSMYGIFAYIWLICMVNVGKYTIHG